MIVTYFNFPTDVIEYFYCHQFNDKIISVISKFLGTRKPYNMQL